MNAAAGKNALPWEPDEPDIGKLREFLDTEERESPMFYVGRESVIRRVLASAEGAFDRVAAGEIAAGQTWVVQGAPGAGKTSLLNELRKRPESRGQAPWEGEMPNFVRIPVNCLESERETVRRIAAGILNDEMYRKATEAGSERGGGLDLGGFKASMRGAKRTVTAPPEATFESLKELPEECWARPLVLTVDEIQNARIRALGVLTQLHLGEHDLPIVPVYGGLANSKDALENIEGTKNGLTRIARRRIVTLGRLSREEACHAVKRLCRECGIRNWEGLDLPERIAEQSEGWPQHLHSGLQALAQGLLQANGDMKRVGSKEVLDRERKIRQELHRLRKTPEMEDASVYVGKVMEAALTQRVSKPALLEFMDRVSEQGRWKCERLPEGMTAETFLHDHLVRKGALQRDPDDPDGGLACPIPCFARHLIEAGRKTERELSETVKIFKAVPAPGS